MAQLPNVFKPSQTEDASFQPIPAGWYLSKLVKSEMKNTKANDGSKYLACTFKIMGGKYNNRLVFTNLNLINKNDTAVRIAESDLKKICESVGFDGDLEDSADLHGIPLGLKVTIKEATAQWPAGNEIKDYCDEQECPEPEEADDDENPFEGFDGPDAEADAE